MPKLWSSGKFLDTVNAMKDIIFDTGTEETCNLMRTSKVYFDSRIFELRF
jgi:hypothetical protein